jgi:hypothetical protein
VNESVSIYTLKLSSSEVWQVLQASDEQALISRDHQQALIMMQDRTTASANKLRQARATRSASSHAKL